MQGALMFNIAYSIDTSSLCTYITRQTKYTGYPLSLLPPLDRKKCELINTRVFTINYKKAPEKETPKNNYQTINVTKCYSKLYS